MVNHNRNMIERCDSKELCRCKCPLNGACFIKDVVYEAKAISVGETKYYVGAAEDEWKRRF